MKKIITLILVAICCFSCFSLTACNNTDEIVCYTNAFFAPFEYYDGTDIVGVDVEIMAKVGEKMGKTVKIEDKDFSILIDTTAEGKLCDCAAAGITITDARKEKVNFSVPYYTSVQYAIFKKGDFTASKNSNNEDVLFWSDLAGKKIGCQLDTTGNIYVNLEIEGDGPEYPGELNGTNASCTPYDTAQLAYEALKAGTSIDVLVVDELPAKFLVKNDLNDYVAIPLYYTATTATEEEYAIAVNKNQTELLNAINEVLNEMLADVNADGQNAVEVLVMKHFNIQ